MSYKLSNHPTSLKIVKAWGSILEQLNKCLCVMRFTEDMYMCVYVNLCMNIDNCICIYVCMYMCVWYVFEYMCIVMYGYIYMCLWICQWACMSMYVCIYVWLCIELGESRNGCENRKWETIRGLSSLFLVSRTRT